LFRGGGGGGGAAGQGAKKPASRDPGVPPYLRGEPLPLRQ
jgi:hypothetical protein